MNSALHVQIIRTHWTKSSRGAPAATARARVPFALPLDVAATNARRGWLTVETYNFGEPDFAAPAIARIETRELADDLRYKQGAFSLDWDGQNATTRWQWTALSVGAPKPKFFNREMGHFEVAPKTWVRLRWHGRFSDQDSGDWSYQQTVVNVARCDADLNVDFVGEPARLFEWLPQLR